jgi:tetratricopeptide (TPR) repeat protein
MEPIGTITQYFPFIDEETKNILENIMAEASDYYDFVHRLRDLILTTNSPVMVAYFAIHHSMIALDYKHIDKIREKYGQHPVLGPNLFFSSAYQGTYEDVKKVHELADAVLATQPEDWISLEMNFMKFEADMVNYPASMYQTKTLDKIRELIDSDSRFGFYEITLNDFLALHAQIDGDSEALIRCIDRGLNFAKEFDDRLRMAHLLIRKSSIITNQDRNNARKLLEQAYQIVNSSLEIPVFYSEILYNLSILDAIRGEFDSAIRRCLEAATIRERAGLNTGNASYYLSLFYNAIGEPASGLEWGRMAEDQFKSRPNLINRAMLNQIWSLILLKRVTEAQALIDMSRESILKSGDVNQIAWLHFVTGVFELEQGDPPLALSSVEQGLRIYEQQGSSSLMELFFLHQLAKIETLSCGSEEDAVSPSLAILEDRALSEDLPGILGQALLLKADLAILGNDEALLREIIPQLRALSDQENLQFLKPYFDSLLRRL